jgi:hypothetical protein
VDQTIQQLDDYLLNHLETKTAIFSNGYYVHRYMHDSMDPVSQWMMNTAVRRLLVSGIRSMGWNKVLRTHAWDRQQVGLRDLKIESMAMQVAIARDRVGAAGRRSAIQGPMGSKKKPSWSCVRAIVCAWLWLPVGLVLQDSFHRRSQVRCTCTL